MPLSNVLIPLGAALSMASFSAPAYAVGFLDDAIFSVKCAGAADKDACKAKAKQDADDYARNRRGEPMASGQTSGSVTSDGDYRERCEVVDAQGPVDVDVAYNRAMDALSVQTPEQLGDTPRHPGYKHTRVPGVRYEFNAGARIPKYEDALVNVASIVLKKRENGKGTKLQVEFCMGTSSKYPNPHFDNASFWSAASGTFRKLVQ